MSSSRTRYAASGTLERALLPGRRSARQPGRAFRALHVLVGAALGVLVLALLVGTWGAPPPSGATPALRPMSSSVANLEIPAVSARVHTAVEQASSGAAVVAGDLAGAVDDPGPRPTARPGTEAAYFAAFSSEARRDSARLAARAPEVLLSAGPVCEKVALLRALFETDSPALVSAFVLAIGSAPDVSNAQTDSLPSFALRLAGERGRRHQGARRVLREVAFLQEPAVAPSLRRRAAAHWAACATSSEARALIDHLLCESDVQLVQGALAALDRNPHPGVVAEISPLFERPAALALLEDPDES